MRPPRLLAGGVLLTMLVLAGALAARRDAANQFPRTVRVGRMPGWVAVDERTDRVFVTNSVDHTVSVLDADSGAMLRTVAVDSEPDLVIPDRAAGRMFVLGDLFHDTTVLNAASGALLGRIPESTWRLLVDEGNGHVLLWGIPPGRSTLQITVLDGRGEVLHTAAQVGATSWGDGAVDSASHRAFVTNIDSDVVSVMDTSTGRLVRLVTVGHRPVSVAIDSLTHHAFIANNWDDTVTVLDSRTGTVLHTIMVGPNPARIVVDEQTARVFVVHGRGSPGNNPNNGLMPFVGITTTGTTVLDARGGTVLAQLPVGGSPYDDVGLGNAVNLAVDERRGRVFVINATPAASTEDTANGSVSVLDARGGRVLRTVPVGRHPVALAVDETTGRLFVVNTNSGCVSVDAWRWVPAPLRRRLPFIPPPPPPGCAMRGTITVIDTTRL